MIGFDVTNTNMEKKQSAKIQNSLLNKKNLNESSDFDLDNY